MAFFGLLSALGAIIGFIMAIVYGLKKNPKWKKYLIGGMGSLILMIILIVVDGPATSPTNTPAETKAVQTIEEQIEKIVQDATKRNFKKVDISKSDDNKMIVEIHMLGNENLTTSLMRKSIYRDGADLFKKIYTSNLPIKEVREVIYLPLTDKYGNTSDGVVVKMTLNNITAAKINWEGVDRLGFDKVADSSWTHPTLLKE